MIIHSLIYHHDSSRLFERIAHQPWAMLLDSGQLLDASTGKPGSQFGRYDIMTAQPFAMLTTRGAITEIVQNGVQTSSEDDPFLVLKKLLQNYQAPKSIYPFSGGALGYFAYDLGRRLEALANTSLPEPIPDMMIGFYDWVIIVDHRDKRTDLVSHCLHASTLPKLDALQKLFNLPYQYAEDASVVNTDFSVNSSINVNFTAQQYTQAFTKIEQYINNGDCYQVNLAQRFSALVAGNSWQAYKKLREISPAPFMAYLNLPLNAIDNFQVLSNSPERFLQTDGCHVETRPIKGTRPRSKDVKEDLANAQALLNSEKDRAENVMIVDLLRNDLGKNCEIGSVKATHLFQLQSFANVHHLVSIIIGKIRQGASAIDMLRGAFPGGSITGAPKLRAMQIIEELEPNRRGLYCGAIGYVSFDGNMDTNIAIRTAVICKNELSFYAGGGIVADSQASTEFNEILDKASNFNTLIKFFMKR